MCAIGLLIYKALTERRLHSNEAKMRNTLKFAGVPQTPYGISAVSGLKFAIFWDMRSRYCPWLPYCKLSSNWSTLTD